MNRNLLSWRQISQLFRPFSKLTKTHNHLTWEISAKAFTQSIVAPCTLGVFVAARLECFPALLCVLIFHQVLLNTEEGSRPPTSQINCLIDCRGGSEADGWPYKDLMRPYLQTFKHSNIISVKWSQGLATGHRTSLVLQGSRWRAPSQRKRCSRAARLPSVGLSSLQSVPVASCFFLSHPLTCITSLSGN